MRSTISRFIIAQGIFKTLPFIVATLFATTTIMECYDLYPTFIEVAFGTSFLTIALMYYVNYLFNLCRYHRIMIHYQSAILITYVAEDLLGFEISGDFWVEFVVGLYGVFLIVYSSCMLFGCRYERNGETNKNNGEDTTSK